MVSAVLTLILGTAACASRTPDDSDYGLQLATARRVRDAAFRSRSDLVADAWKDKLLPLVYFAPDSSYNVPATLTRSANEKPVEMVYSDGVIRAVRRVGTLEFTLKGQPHRLSAFVEVASRDENGLFVPFGDLTNRNETYPAGRLLDLNRTPSGFYDLDFNRAYNPTCYFNPTYSCPVPRRRINFLSRFSLARE